ncbi:uncharacterized protein OCT59_020845 [Rhizophagus irregularis]|uniref:Uncharacterized protein n=1 Tax=Rhizophagus irregularis (strain DAOM 181602 / DAOM 197198 / MUCL 43194) TaxID=747089 RepID=U9UF45_RHIID|nr:hypothetical protein OCT59_020845 [Rhizophagus irregularis]
MGDNVIKALLFIVFVVVLEDDATSIVVDGVADEDADEDADEGEDDAVVDDVDGAAFVAYCGVSKNNLRTNIACTITTNINKMLSKNGLSFAGCPVEKFELSKF